ncbi:MAG: hypothetical protein AAF483_12820 [Planctomycetota bacterium]
MGLRLRGFSPQARADYPGNNAVREADQTKNHALSGESSSVFPVIPSLTSMDSVKYCFKRTQ